MIYVHTFCAYRKYCFHTCIVHQAHLLCCLQTQKTKYQEMGFHECQPLSTIVVVVVANEMSRVPYHHGSREVHSALNYTANTRAKNRTQTHTLTFDKVAQIVKVLEGVFRLV